MKTTIPLLGLALGAALGQGCQDEHYFCGDGTTPVDGYCIGSGGDCGPGTHEEDGQCVLDQDVVVCGDGTEDVDGECVPITETGLPPELTSVTSPTPYPSGGLMILQGDNFMLADSGALHVTVEGVETTNVQVLTNNYAIADLPASAIATVEVGIQNDLGDDAADFQYIGLYAAEGGCWGGKAFGPIVDAPELHVIDPRTGASAVVGALTSAAGAVLRPVTAMAFDDAGTLWAVEAVCYADEASLMTIDRYTGAATVVATITVPAEEVIIDAFGPPPLTHAAITDITFLGDVLYGWSDGRSDLITINTTTGAVTPIDTSVSGDGGGLTATDAGELLYSEYGEDLDLLGSDGTYLGYASFSTETYYLSSLAWLNGSLYATGGDGYDGVVRFDYQADEVVGFGPTTYEYDALATPPELDGTPGASPELESELPPELRQVQALDPDVDLAAYEPRPVPGRRLAAKATATAVDVLAAVGVELADDGRGRRAAPATSLDVADHVTFRSPDGALTLRRGELAGYRLVENRKGQLKLVGADGVPVLKRITSVETR